MNAENEILKELQEMQSPLAGMPREMPYAVPDGYFTVARENLVAAIGTSLVQKHDMPYTAPEGYFDTLPGNILSAARAAGKPKAIGRGISLRRMQWLNAAVLALVISIGGYMALNSRIDNSPEGKLATVPSTAIKEYVEHRYGPEVPATGDADIARLKLNNKEIISYLDETGWE